MKKILLPIFAAFFLISGSFTASAENDPAQQAIRDFIKNIKAINFSAPASEIDAKAAKAQVFLDFETLSKKSLPKDWDNAGEKNQQEFLNLIQELIKYVAYPRSARLMKNDDMISFVETKKEGNGFQVKSVIHEQEKGLDVSVVYHLYSKEGQWKIDDVILDDVSLNEDLQSQFEKIIAKSGFEGLLQKMRERLEKAKQTAASPEPEASN